MDVENKVMGTSKEKPLGTFIPIELGPDGSVDVVIKGDYFRDYFLTGDFERFICSEYKRGRLN